MDENRSAAKPTVLDFRAMVLLLVLCASWGLQQVTIRYANQGISPLWQAAFRSTGAALLVGGWMIARRKPLLDRDGTLWWGIAAGVLFSLEFICIYWGLEFTTASRAVIFLYLSPFVVALGAHWVIPGEGLQPLQTLGLCCAFSGIVLAFGESFAFPDWKILVGDGLLVAAAIFWGATTVLIKAGPLARVHPGKTLLYQLAVSAILLSLGSLIKNEAGVFKLTPLIASCLIYQTIWVASVTYLAWFWLIRTYSPSRVASFTFLTPLFGVLAGWFLLAEPISALLLAALVLVAGGIYLVNRPNAVAAVKYETEPTAPQNRKLASSRSKSRP